MTQKELATLKQGDTVVHKQSGKVYTYHHTVKAWDFNAASMTRSNEHGIAVCLTPNEPVSPYANYQYFEAKHIKKG